LAQCPNCAADVAPTAPQCTACGAIFSGDGWKPIEPKPREAPVLKTDNPFEPPRASLETPPRERGPAPAAVRYAVRIIWISAALAVPFAIVASESFVAFAGNLIGIGILALFAWNISIGKNWARWVFGIIIGLGTAMFLYSAIVFSDVWVTVPLATRAFNFLQYLLQLVAVVLVFLPASNEWFAASQR
jgi:hypothetical protein